jgi:osmotically inducible protein OsmC
MATHTARATWEGDLAGGSGQAELDSGAASAIDMTWKGRVEGVSGMSSPEELLAAAHASCFSMALSHELGQGGNAPERISVSAAVSIEPVEGGFAVKRSELTVRGSVPGIDAETFTKAAVAAAKGCPISGALSDDVDISVDATLE